MKGIIGSFSIFIIYLCSGIFLGTWPFKYGYESWTIYLISYSIISIMLYYSSKIVNRYRGIKGIIICLLWVSISTIYGVIKMKEDHDLFFSGDWNKFFGWEFVLWEAGIPIYIGTSQLVFIGGYFSIRTVILANNLRDDSNKRIR
ncbi:hypothetical protein SAMN04487969_113168 [Paenibacillus algorifonticola]|uniref:Uncharacterized protein n=1 Tax=Paenibacillus algorifonticola TaxID=684063 RepID=A0A1I2FV57_9BACL|nr:hypothetical protein [Paenibacillus algorifonticola]SFF09262.1 hypothetical protein SAMN04487969_113168 [Paenibacillus algorifonticola]